MKAVVEMKVAARMLKRPAARSFARLLHRERAHITFLHRDFPEGAMVETDASGNLPEQSSEGINQTILSGVDVNFVPWNPLIREAPDFQKDGFVFFDETEHYSDSAEIKEFADMANSNADLEIGDIAKNHGKQYARAFQSKAAQLLHSREKVGGPAIMVPTQAMLRRASGPGSSGRYLPHVDFDYRQNTNELSRLGGTSRGANTFWRIRGCKRALFGRCELNGSMKATDILENPAFSEDLFDLFSTVFNVCGLQTVWVALNETPCYNNQLALCSWPSIDKRRDLKVYEIFGPGIKAIGLHPNEDQRWYAPATLKFGQGVRFDAMKAPHVAVNREAEEAQQSEPRLSVECRVLMLGAEGQVKSVIYAYARSNSTSRAVRARPAAVLARSSRVDRSHYQHQRTHGTRRATAVSTRSASR